MEKADVFPIFFHNCINLRIYPRSEIKPQKHAKFCNVASSNQGAKRVPGLLIRCLDHKCSFVVDVSMQNMRGK